MQAGAAQQAGRRASSRHHCANPLFRSLASHNHQTIPPQHTQIFYSAAMLLYPPPHPHATSVSTHTPPSLPHLQHLPEQPLLLIQQHQARPVPRLPAQYQRLLWVVLGRRHVRLPAALQQVVSLVAPGLGGEGGAAGRRGRTNRHSRVCVLTDRVKSRNSNANRCCCVC